MHAFASFNSDFYVYGEEPGYLQAADACETLGWSSHHFEQLPKYSSIQVVTIRSTQRAGKTNRLFF